MGSPVVNDRPAAIDLPTDSSSSTGILLIWTTAAVLLLIQILGVRLFLRGKGYIVDPFHGFAATVGFVGCLLVAAVTVRRIFHPWISSAGFNWWPEDWRGRAYSVAQLAAVTLVFSLAAFAYSWPKVMIPVFNPSLWDNALIGFDTALCLGIDPNEFLLAVFQEGPKQAAWLLDRHYAMFVFSQGVVTAWFLSDPQSRRRVVFGLTIIFLWLVGTWSYVILPSLGPVYVVEGLLVRIAETFPINAAAQIALLKNYENVQLLMKGESVIVAPHLGIAAMPSLHVAVHFFLFLWGRFVKSRLRHLLLIMATLTLIGSVATGWHYLVDGLAGLAIAGGIFAVSVVLYRQQESSGFVAEADV